MQGDAKSTTLEVAGRGVLIALVLHCNNYFLQLDYHGIAASVYVLLFGKYLNVSTKGGYSIPYLPRYCPS